MSFGRDTKTSRPFCLVSMPGEVKDPTGGKCVTCSGLTNSHWTLNALQRAPPHPEKKLNHVFLMRPKFGIQGFRSCYNYKYHLGTVMVYFTSFMQQ